MEYSLQKMSKTKVEIAISIDKEEWEAYAKEAYKNDPALGLEIKKHESWRDNKDFELGMLKERPFHNTSVYASRNYPQGEKEGDTFAAYCKSTKYIGRKIDVAAERRLIAGKVR